MPDVVVQCAAGVFRGQNAIAGDPRGGVEVWKGIRYALKQPNGSEQMWRGRAAGGYESKVCLILPGWCLSTRPPSARTW